MKNLTKICLLFFFLAFCSFIKIANNPSSYNDQELIKKWYVKEAYILHENGRKEEKPKNATGSIFTFKSNFILDITDNSEDEKPKNSSKWTKIDDDHIEIEFISQTVIFEVKILTEKTLHLVSQKNEFPQVLNLIFTSNFIAYKPSK